MKVKVYNQENKAVGEMELPKSIFEVEMNTDLVHQVAVSQMWNRKQKTAHTKDRGDKRGGGKKPWRQKGTGRARHGSTRSPIWIGGGVTFGPRTEKVLKRTIPTKMKRKALFMVLSSKAKQNFITVLDVLKADGMKTKPMVESLNKILPEKGSKLVVLPTKDDNVIKSINNIERIDTIQAKDINALDLLNYKFVLIPKESVKVIEETFTEKKKVIKKKEVKK